MKLKFFWFTILASAASTEEKATPTQPLINTAGTVAKNPVDETEIKAIRGGTNLLAPPCDESEGGHRHLHPSTVQALSPLAGETIGADHSFQAFVSGRIWILDDFLLLVLPCRRR